MKQEPLFGLGKGRLLVIFFAIAVIIITLSLVPVSDVFRHVTRTNANDFNIDINAPEKGSVSVGSILGSDTLDIPSDQNMVDKFLDTYEPAGITATEKFGIEIKPVLVNSDGIKIPLESSFFGLVPATLYGEKGELLDLGQIHFSFYGVTKSEETLTVLAKYKVTLNDEVIAQNSLYGKGKTTNKSLLLTTGNRETFAFSFADEPTSKFKEGDKANVFRVYITEVDAILGDSFDNTRRFLSNSEFPIFTMSISYDSTKHVIKDYNGKAVSVFKADGVLDVCSIGYWFVVKANGQPSIISTSTPSITVKTISGELIANIDSFSALNQEIFSGKPYGSRYDECKRIVGIPRSSEVNIFIDGLSYNLKTDILRPSLKVNSDVMGFKFSPVGQYNGRVEYIEKTTSNIGYEKTQPITKYY